MVTLIVCLIVFLIALGGTIGTEGILVLAGIVVLLCIYFGIKWSIEGKIAEKEQKEKQKTDKHNQQLRDFHILCKKAGIVSVQSEEDWEKVAQIANLMQLGDVDVRSFYLEAATLAWKDAREIEAKKRQEQEAALEKIRVEERAKCAELEKYSTFSGREKRLAMLRDTYTETLKKAPPTRDQLCRPIAYARQSDWAIQGGIASGIAGPAAGLATAMDIQRQNAEERARADALNDAYISALVRSGALERAASGEKEHKETISRLQKRISKAESALVDTLSTEECFNMLEFSNATVTVTKTGTCKVSVKCGLKGDIYIFDDIKGTIDGTVLAKISDNGMTVGSAKLVLPLKGIPTMAPVSLKGMCLFCGQPYKKYGIQFEGANLWAMEKE